MPTDHERKTVMSARTDLERAYPHRGIPLFSPRGRVDWTSERGAQILHLAKADGAECLSSRSCSD